MVLSQGRHRTPKSWTSYRAARLLGEASQSLRPLPSASLHPIEDCTLEFMCPMVAENLKVVGPGTMFCDRCNKNVYLVTSQEELNERAKNRQCVMMRRSDIDPAAADRTVIEVAVIYDAPVTAQLAKHFLATIAAACDDDVLPPELPPTMHSARSPYATPTLAVRPRTSAGNGSTPSRMCRFHLLTLEEALAHSDNSHGANEKPGSEQSFFTSAVRLVSSQRGANTQSQPTEVPFFKSLESCGGIAITIETTVSADREINLGKKEAEQFNQHVAHLLLCIDEKFNPQMPMSWGAPVPPPEWLAANS